MDTYTYLLYQRSCSLLVLFSRITTCRITDQKAKVKVKSLPIQDEPEGGIDF